ncbi:hypothetical protein B4O85_13570 [Pseudomonas azotoformans]|uniref:DUF1534 domain-containing protein n=1 Tax=Pseudomonas azotoformans TaxID=47878 RepID=A0A4Q0HTE6_PSEAZ|nr:hypothetical protein B4O85_13570 [Pseudomonas azotoformans]
MLGGQCVAGVAERQKEVIVVLVDLCRTHDRSHAMRGNVSSDAPRHGRGASWAAFPRGAWERSEG